jgi:enoyl-CoA hydratase
MTQGRVTVERHDRVALLTLDRADRGNAIDQAMVDSLAEAVSELAAELPRALVVAGSGTDAFCSGLDIRADGNPLAQNLLAAVKARAPDRIKALLLALREPFDRLVTLPIPVVAAVNGLAFGAGAELAVRCDLRVADASASFCFINTRLGLTTSLGGGPALARLVGPARAADLLLTARKVPITEAYGLGLVNRPSQPGQAVETALEVAAMIASNAPRAIRATLGNLRRDLTSEMDAELDTAADVFASGDFAYGIHAARTRSAPEFPDVP